MTNPSHTDRTSSGLTWGPVWQPLESRVREGDRLLLVISPFIGLEALKRFLPSSDPGAGTKVLIRWRPQDLWAGVSDIAIYPYLTRRGIPLYINYDIHLKLYVFESNIAFSTSGNLTLRGLGYSERKNIEVGTFVRLGQEDWARIYELITGSKQVDEETFQHYQRYLENCPQFSAPPAPPLDLLGPPKTYTISSLPATEMPVKLANYYFGRSEEHSPEAIRRAIHDLVIFGVTDGLNKEEFFQRLCDSFRRTPFVVEFIQFLQTERSLRFGAVNDWIHRKCEDVPLPYRWEIKENTHIFYNWLEHFVPEITWDRPNYSQIIYWRQE